MNKLLRLDGSQPEQDVWAWWKDHKNTLPNLSCLFKFVALLQPTSAGAERVFSLYRKMDWNAVTSEETLSLGSCLYYNYRKK